MKKYLAEAVGTMVLVLMGCGAAVSLGCNNADPETVVGTAMAFGLAVVAMAYTIGGISGCHINPAITLGVFLSGKMSGKDACGYMCGQVIGGIIGALILFILTSTSGLVGTGANDLQANGAGTIPVLGGLLAEIFFTCVFVLVVLGATAKTNGATNNFAGLAIGLPFHRSRSLPGRNSAYKPLDFHRWPAGRRCLRCWYLEGNRNRGIIDGFPKR